MKSIIYISPVDAMSGCLSGPQNLQYDSAGGRAWNMPNGTHAALAYRPRLIAVRRASDGRKYFMVRTRSSAKLSDNSRITMALMGAAGAVFAALLRNKTGQLYKDIRQAYEQTGKEKTFRAWAINIIRSAIDAGNSQITFTAGVAMLNPWKNNTQTAGYEIPAAVVNKFANQLT